MKGYLSNIGYFGWMGEWQIHAVLNRRRIQGIFRGVIVLLFFRTFFRYPYEERDMVLIGSIPATEVWVQSPMALYFFAIFTSSLMKEF